jgi:hypothetical protein
MSAMKLTLLSRPYCHLCAEMEEALAPIAADFGVAVEVLDVDADPVLVERYDELVPVLLHDGVELCHHFLDAGRVRDFLCGIRSSGD